MGRIFYDAALDNKILRRYIIGLMTVAYNRQMIAVNRANVVAALKN